MRQASLCPFCYSRLVVITGETELLTHQRCAQCAKHWAEAKVSSRAVDQITASSAEPIDRPHPLPEWSPP
jgi:hypothetical protein